MDHLTFVPHPLFCGGHLQTIVGHVLGKVAPPADYTTEMVPLPDGDQLVLHIDGEARSARDLPLVVLMHGLSGCSASYYILRISRHLVALGYTVVRFNHRTCSAQGLKLAKNIYHAGRSDDLYECLRHLRRTRNQPVLVVGFSLSGNVVLKLAGEMGPKISKLGVKKILSVCPPTDLEYCSKFFSRPANRHLDQYFSNMLRATARKRDEAHSFQDSLKVPPIFNLRMFDELYTAPLAGFKSRREYYDQSSAAPIIENIAVKTHILAAADDPIVPAEHLVRLRLPDQVTVQLEKGGGHMGFLADKKTPLGDRRWLDFTVVQWALQP